MPSWAPASSILSKAKAGETASLTALAGPESAVQVFPRSVDLYRPLSLRTANSVPSAAKLGERATSIRPVANSGGPVEVHDEARLTLRNRPLLPATNTVPSCAYAGETAMV